MHRLYKDRQNAMLGGVCSGIADSLGIDVTLVRALAVIINTIFTPMISVYFLLLLILPDKTQAAETERKARTAPKPTEERNFSPYIRTAVLAAVIFMVVVVITEAFFKVDIKIKYIIIFTSIIFGLYLITTKDLHSNPSKRVITGAAVCMLTLVWLASSTGFLYLPIAVIISTLVKIWPLLLAAVGLSLLMQNKKYVSVMWMIILAASVVITVINYISVLI